MRKLVLDIETKNSFQDVGSTDPRALDISLLVIYDYEDDKYKSFLEADFPKLWPLLESADLIIGFNLDYFDIPILNKYFPGDLTKKKSLDLLLEIKKASGRRASLNAVAAGTLGKGKSGHGLEAVIWWQRGEIEKIRKYCEEDVRLTKEVYEYALNNSSLKYEARGKIVEVKLDTRKWSGLATAANNYSMPF